MSETSRNLIKIITELSSIDKALTTVERERKQIERELEEKKNVVKRAKELRESKKKQTEERKTRSNREERAIRDENDKLIARRKALSTLNNYKLQQAAEREIEGVAHQLSVREEGLLKLLDESDASEKELASAIERYEQAVSSYEAFSKEAAEILTTLEERFSRHSVERERILPQLEPQELTVYQRIKDRWPDQPVAPVRNNICSGCFMQMGPQILVQISRGSALVKCPGCSRIVYLEESQGE
jgi:uncharacterized protein